MELPSAESLLCPQTWLLAACSCEGLEVPTSPCTHSLAKMLPAWRCQEVARQGWGGVSPVSLIGSGFSYMGHLRHPSWYGVGAVRMHAILLTSCPSTGGFLWGKQSQ